jgi:hypothetical protein
LLRHDRVVNPRRLLVVPIKIAAGAVLLGMSLGLALAPVALGAPRKDLVANAGIIGVAITNLGYVGNGFTNPRQPSCEYPLNSHVEHLFLGGLWVGARTADGSIHVSTGAQDASTLVAGDEVRETQDAAGEPVYVWSNSQNSDNYNELALATQHIQVVFDDYATIESGNHIPLGLKVILRALAWGNPYADDFVILDYAIINISGSELRDVYVGYWNDTTIGNTEITNPYDPQAAVRWNYYDDMNGAWGAVGYVPEEFTVPYDPHIWMMYEHDDTGEDGNATSWVGTRLLGAYPPVAPPEGQSPVSYNAWMFRHVPAQDDEYVDDVGDLQPGKYQIMKNGAFTVGETQGENYTIASDWVALLSTGPYPFMAPGDTIHATFAICCGPDSLGLLANSKVAQVAYDQGFTIPIGPPSPRLELSFDDNTVILAWDPGDSVRHLPDGGTEPLPIDDPRRSPEHHISTITGKGDFQGYRIYRYQGTTFTQDPYDLATLVAEYDKVDGIGFDTGLPPLNAQGQRVVRDTNLLDGFPYWYSVVSFSAPDLEEGLPSFQSGFNENSRLVYPGPAPSTSADRRTVGVYPNPYRAGSLFDSPRGERELGRKIWFTGLPVRCRIQVFNLAGDLVKTIHHDDPTSGQEPWDVLSEPVRAIATGLYIFVVEDLENGDLQRGKLVIIK